MEVYRDGNGRSFIIPRATEWEWPCIVHNSDVIAAERCKMEQKTCGINNCIFREKGRKFVHPYGIIIDFDKFFSMYKVCHFSMSKKFSEYKRDICPTRILFTSDSIRCDYRETMVYSRKGNIYQFSCCMFLHDDNSKEKVYEGTR